MEQELRILVLQRGWVVVGYYSQTDDECVLTDAAVIRRWGTTKGIGELVNGPTQNTILNKCGEVRAAKLAVVLHIVAENNDAWAKALR